MPNELELKYIVSEDFSIIRVLELLTKNGYWVMDYENVRNEDAYYDSRTKKLLRNKSSLIIRTSNEKYMVTLKIGSNVNDGLLDRSEIEFSIKDTSFKSIVDALKDVDFDLSEICPFPSLSLINDRYKVLLRKNDAFVEVSLDKVRYHNLSNGCEEVDYMVEIEAKENTKSEELRNIDKIIKENIGLVLNMQSKYERGLLLTSTQNMIRKRVD